MQENLTNPAEQIMDTGWKKSDTVFVQQEITDAHSDDTVVILTAFDMVADHHNLLE